MKAILIVIDGFGIGELPDADLYGDRGANTYKSISDGLFLPNLAKLGLNNIFGVDYQEDTKPIGSYARMRELSVGKDTLTGHHELAGIITYKAAPTFPNGFPDEVTEKLKTALNTDFLGNIAASGTEIIKMYGDEHIKTKKPILYTSADSVMQIACHEDIISIDKLYSMCETAREIMVGEYEVGRIIARPFIGQDGNFKRTENRKDFGIKPRTESILKRLSDNGIKTIAIGKINDIFSGEGIDINVPAHGNKEVAQALLSTIGMDNCFVFANFVDTDMLYGHRNDVEGYKQCMLETDAVIGDIIRLISPEDLLIVTSDHGCDPSFSSTDHTREYVPLLIYGDKIKHGLDFGTVHGFNTVAYTLSDFFGIYNCDKSLLNELTFEPELMIKKILKLKNKS